MPTEDLYQHYIEWVRAQKFGKGGDELAYNKFGTFLKNEVGARKKRPNSGSRKQGYAFREFEASIERLTREKG